MKKTTLLCLAALLPWAVPATAAPLSADELLTAAGLTPGSTAADALRLHGPGQDMGNGGFKFLNKGSQSDPWLTFKPGSMVYVDCDEAPANLPDDAIGKICAVATGKDWKKALKALEATLSLGTPTPEIMHGDSHPEEAEHAPGADNDSAVAAKDGDDDDDDDDDSFVQVARTFHAAGYTIKVEACPRIETGKVGNWHAGVIVNWIKA